MDVGESRADYTAMASFPVKTARELMDDEFDARWLARERVGPAARGTLAAVLDRFVAEGGPVDVAALAKHDGLGEHDVEAAVAELDAADLLAMRDGRVILAYPFASAPTGFLTVLAGGAERHACCAIDALGIAPMLGQRVIVRARCHHCGEAIEMPVDVDRPQGSPGIMAWIGRRDTLRAKACDGL
jgi:hypothetical protein